MADGSERAASVELAADDVRDRLREAVRIRLRADVDVGVLLSGGLDSSIITHLIRQQAQDKLRSFSVRFEDPRFDESAQQETIIEQLDLKHESVTVRSRDIAENFEHALWHTEIPQFRTAFVPMFMLSRLIRDHRIKVVLSGEGADEIFFGYNIFKETNFHHKWEN